MARILITLFVVLVTVVHAKTNLCTQDTFTCPDGTVVGRDPTINCEFSCVPTCEDKRTRYRCKKNSKWCRWNKCDGTCVSRLID